MSARANNYIEARLNIFTCAPLYIYIYIYIDVRAYKSAPRHAWVRDSRHNDIELHLYTSTSIYKIGVLVVLVALIGHLFTLLAVLVVASSSYSSQRSAQCSP